LAEAECARVVEGRLQRVADVELDVVHAVERHEVLAVGACGGDVSRLLGHGGISFCVVRMGRTMIPRSMCRLNPQSLRKCHNSARRWMQSTSESLRCCVRTRAAPFRTSARAWR